MTNIPILFLELSGPLQSWGVLDKWTVRTTRPFPTKSGVIGLIACAMGVKRNDKKLFELNKKINMATRVEKKGEIMSDYHTITGIIRTADNGFKSSKNTTLLSDRYYLQDAKFTVALTAESPLLEECLAALKNPKWQIYLGRKCCVPTRPVFKEISYDYSSLEEAITKYPSDSEEPFLTYEIDDNIGAYQRDVLTASNYPQRNYTERIVATKSIKKEADKNVSD